MAVAITLEQGSAALRVSLAAACRHDLSLWPLAALSLPQARPVQRPTHPCRPALHPHRRRLLPPVPRPRRRPAPQPAACQPPRPALRLPGLHPHLPLRPMGRRQASPGDVARDRQQVGQHWAARSCAFEHGITVGCGPAPGTCRVACTCSLSPAPARTPAPCPVSVSACPPSQINCPLTKVCLVVQHPVPFPPAPGPSSLPAPTPLQVP